MNEKKVHELLKLYFEGATTLEEERELQRYFAGNRIDASLEAYRPMFAFFDEERVVKPPPVRKMRSITAKLSVITGIAASIAILLWIGLPQAEPVDDFVYFVNGTRVYDETAAIAIAENKLQMLSASMQTARNSMAAFEKLHESTQTFAKISNAFRIFEEVKEESGLKN